MAYILLPLTHAAKVCGAHQPANPPQRKTTRVKTNHQTTVKQSNAIRRIERYEIKTRIYLA